MFNSIEILITELHKIIFLFLESSFFLINFSQLQNLFLDVLHFCKLNNYFLVFIFQSVALLLELFVLLLVELKLILNSIVQTLTSVWNDSHFISTIAEFLLHNFLYAICGLFFSLNSHIPSYLEMDNLLPSRFLQVYEFCMKAPISKNHNGLL